MAKYYGSVGYAVTEEVGLSKWEPKIVERQYKGDVIRRTGRRNTTEHQNDDIDISQEISIVADPYAYEHFYAIKYVTWMGVKWRVSSIDVQRPRLILSIGGVYNDADEE